MDLKEIIIKKSKELNIDAIGFTDALPLFNLEEYLKYRYENNKATEFEETDLRKRIDPKLTMENCKTIIVIGLSYNVDYRQKANYKLRGSLSRSSWGVDYHRVVKDKLVQLAKEINKVQDFDYKAYVDTGPLIDRELAYKAGMGYYGKNCNIINQRYGSFIFIGYMLTDLEIDDFDDIVENQCGDCELCLTACPTNALEDSHRLNPKRCISYLTQTKDEIDIDLKKRMGVKIYGCDTCQLVCPKNKDAEKSKHEEFIPYVTKGSIDLKEMLVISNKEFKNKYGHMAGSWRGKKIFKRNAINALNNIEEKNNKELINKLLK